MKIHITADELIARWLWDEVCEMRGINVYAVCERLMDSDEELEFTEDEARELGLIR